MKRNFPDLFSPITVRGKLFKNRIISAPIGAWVFSEDNYIFDYAIDMFGEKAIGGAGAVTVGHTEINYHEPDEDGFGLYFNLRGRGGTAALSEFAEAIRSHGSHASIELNYGGLYKGGNPNGIYYGPSAYIEADGSQIREMDEAKIAQTVKQYADCAARMKNSGFDMVTIHGAHGWLPEQFRSSKTNHRTDRFGGSAENRMRFPIMVIDAIRDAVGDDFLIEYRMGGADPEKSPEEFQELLQFVKAIENKIDILHLSTSFDPSLHERTIPTYFLPRALNLPYARGLKDAGVKVPIAIVGAISDPETADRIIREGMADFVAMARSLIADPQFPNKARRGQTEDITPCIGCMHCLSNMHKTHIIGCSVNPRTGREHRIAEIMPAKTAKKVVIIGGGPAGMEAAITAADRGHQVTLYEKSGELGGLLKISDMDKNKYLLHDFKDYLIRQVNKRDIRLLLNTEATPEMVEAENADAVIVASGSSPIIPKIPGVDGENVFTAAEAHCETEKLGQRVAVIGGNLVGCETALYLRDSGRTVTLIEARQAMHIDANPAVGEAIDNRFGDINLLTDSRCVKISPNSVTVEKDGEETVVPADSVVLAVGMRSNSGVYYDMLDCALDVTPVGDCLQVSNVYGATHTAYTAALDI